MATDRMYELAFAYRSAGLWKRMESAEVFALRLSDGEIGYCSVLGVGREFNALALYVGAPGLRSLRLLLDTQWKYEVFQPDTEGVEVMYAQDCLQCALENKDELEHDELAEVRAYAKRHKLSFRGPNAFPHFVKYTPKHIPWHFTEACENERITEALEASLALDGMLKSRGKAALGLHIVEPGPCEIPLLVREGGGYRVERTDFPVPEAKAYSTQKLHNDVTVARLRRLKKRGAMQCQMLRLPGAVQAGPDEIPWFPMTLFAVDQDRGDILDIKPCESVEDEPGQLLEAFADALLEQNCLPRQISVPDESTFSLLQWLCAKLGIPLHQSDFFLSELEEAKGALLGGLFGGGFFDEDEDEDFDGDGPVTDDMQECIDHAFSLLGELSDSELRKAPKSMRESVLEMADMGLLPPLLEARLRKLWKKTR